MVQKMLKMTKKERKNRDLLTILEEKCIILFNKDSNCTK